MRQLILVLGDQLDPASAALEGLDPAQDAVWMAESEAECEYVWSHKARIVMFLSAMRHFRDDLRGRGITVHYRELDTPGCKGNLGSALLATALKLKPRRIIMTEPGEYRVREALKAAADKAQVELEIRPDRHFLSTPDDFAEYAEGRKQLRMEFFYRRLRRKLNILLEDGQPIGGRWNYDRENRGSFGKRGPGHVPPPVGFGPDATTEQVMRMVNRRFHDHPGGLQRFDWPVTPRQARAALADFVEHRLPLFGLRQDAMWAGEPYLYHSRLSAALNLRLLSPATVIDEACAALDADKAPIEAVEGFVRQVAGWREYVRGVYWRFMPDYASTNHFSAEMPLPAFYWSGKTEMNCLREAITQILEYGYAHHIQRLMVTGLFALLLGVEPREVHRWYLAIHVDAVEWVEMPNTLGMSQFADGGLMASKPYIATGKYINRMSNYCGTCRFRPSDATGEYACPFTVLYWDFLLRHAELLEKTPRSLLQVRSVSRLTREDRQGIRRCAASVRQETLA